MSNAGNELNAQNRRLTADLPRAEGLLARAKGGDTSRQLTDEATRLYDRTLAVARAASARLAGLATDAEGLAAARSLIRTCRAIMAATADARAVVLHKVTPGTYKPVGQSLAPARRRREGLREAIGRLDGEAGQDGGGEAQRGEGELWKWLSQGLTRRRLASAAPVPPTLRSASTPPPPPSRREPPSSEPTFLLTRVKPRPPHSDGTPPTLRSLGGEGEAGWSAAPRRPAGRAQHPGPAGEARRRIGAAAAPAFAAAFDKAVDGRRHPGDAAGLRAAHADAASRAFAGAFVWLAGGRPPASSQGIALGAIIAAAIAQANSRHPIVPPAAVAPMAMLVHRSLRPRLATLAKMAMARAPAAPRPRPALNAREMAW